MRTNRHRDTRNTYTHSRAHTQTQWQISKGVNDIFRALHRSRVFLHTHTRTHTRTHTYVDRHSKWGQHSEDTLKWWFAKLSEDKSLPLLFTSVCSPVFPSLNFRGVHASCTLIAIDGAFKFLDRIHPEFSRTFQIVTTLQKKKKKSHTKFCFAHSKRGWGCIGVCVV